MQKKHGPSIQQTRESLFKLWQFIYIYISDLSCTNYLNSTLQVSCQEAAGEALETLGAVRVPAERVWCCKSTMLRQAGMLPLNGTERVAIYQFNGTVRVAVFIMALKESPSINSMAL